MENQNYKKKIVTINAPLKNCNLCLCALLLAIFGERYLSFVGFFTAGGLAEQSSSFLV